MFTTKEHDMLRNSIREFAEAEIKPIAKELDENETFSEEITNKMGEMGLFGVVIPEKYGGQGMDYLSYIIAIEELARVDSSQAATVAAHNSLGISPIYYFGTEKQKEEYIPKLCTGRHLWGFGLTEPDAGSDSRGSKTKAEYIDGSWVINGSKIFITNASTDITLGITIQTITNENPKEFTTFLVEKDSDGLIAKTMKNKMMWRASNTSELYFDNCKVDQDSMLGKRGDGSKIMLNTLDRGRLSIAAMGLGLAQGAYEMAFRYAHQRKQFGKYISSFQVNTFKLVDMATKIELARNLLYKACLLKDNNKPFAKEAAMAKLYTSEIAKQIADEAVQIHGGYGLMKEYDIERFYRDQRILQIGEGTSEIQRLVIAKHLGINIKG